MAFSRTLLGWAVVTALLVLWHEVERRIKHTPGTLGASLKLNLPVQAAEALLLTLFAGLWFGSLGSGGAVLLFLLLGALMEIPSRLRSQAGGQLPWRAIGVGVVRIVVAGLLLSLVLT